MPAPQAHERGARAAPAVEAQVSDLKERAIQVLAEILEERTTLPLGWSIAPDYRDGGPRNAPTVWLVNERVGKIDGGLAEAIRAEQRRMAVERGAVRSAPQDR